MEASIHTSPLQRIDSHFVGQLPSIDPFSAPGTFFETLLNAILATALFRCWHLIAFFLGWATAVVLISEHVHNLAIQSTLLTVFGTVLGFVISYRTSSSFERYNEGRRYWSAVIQGSRTLARTIWLHIPDSPTEVPEDKRADAKLRTLIEKKTAINLVEAFGISLKHYLRGEETIYYEDLYHLVKFLPSYTLPAGRPSMSVHNHEGIMKPKTPTTASANVTTHRRNLSRSSQTSITLPQDTPTKPRKSVAHVPSLPAVNTISPSPPSTFSKATAPHMSIDVDKAQSYEKQGTMLSPPPHTSASQPVRTTVDVDLMPSRSPPKWSLFDVFPLSLLADMLTDQGKQVEGRKAAKRRAKMGMVNQNIPLEITVYLSSYISALQQRKAIDVPTINTMLLGLNQLVDSLTGLERILTTPIPFSYSIHLWSVCWIYCSLLPFQLVAGFRFITIPATAIATFIFFGFLVAGEEIENPFGYDKNDLNLDHFTQNIISAELDALTSRSPPDPAEWAFLSDNTEIFARNGLGDRGVPPSDWIKKGERSMREVLRRQ